MKTKLYHESEYYIDENAKKVSEFFCIEAERADYLNTKAAEIATDIYKSGVFRPTFLLCKVTDLAESVEELAYLSFVAGGLKDEIEKRLAGPFAGIMALLNR
jgi:hypothetical protein